MTLSDEEIKRLFRIRRTVMQMLRDRGYFVGDFEINMSKEQFIAKFGENMKREDLVINKALRNDSSDQVSLWYPFIISLELCCSSVVCFKFPNVVAAYFWFAMIWGKTNFSPSLSIYIINMFLWSICNANDILRRICVIWLLIFLSNIIKLSDWILQASAWYLWVANLWLSLNLACLWASYTEWSVLSGLIWTV